MKSRILITGGTGFIGRRLAKRLPHPDILKKDIREKLELDEYNVIYHLAGISSPSICESQKDICWDINVNGTKNLVKRLKSHQHLIFASSAYVYGLSSTEKHNEDEKLNPAGTYGKTKKAAEDIIRQYKDKRGFSYCILRFFNIYGPGQRKGFLIPDVIEKYRTGEVVEVVNPCVKRDFVYIDDVIDVLIKAQDIEGTYNVGCGVGTEIGHIYNLIEKELEESKNIKKIIKDNSRDSLVADITRIQGIGWEPKTNIEEGIKKSIAYYLQDV